MLPVKGIIIFFLPKNIDSKVHSFPANSIIALLLLLLFLIIYKKCKVSETLYEPLTLPNLTKLK